MPNAHAEFNSAKDALDFLEITRPIPAGAFVAVHNSPDLLKLYDNQLKAVLFIENVNAIQGARVLIPYLNYPVNYAVMIAGPNPMLKSENLADTKQSWPVFAAILQMQDASTELQKYCLDKKNPLNYRLAAFLVLRYEDERAFHDVEHTFDVEIINSAPSIKKYLKRVENGSAYFWGVPDLS
jgi:hypothetical protein